MNKLMVFPLAILFMLSVYDIVDTNTKSTATSDDYSSLDGITIDGDDASIEIPEADSQEFNIWEGSFAIVIILGAIAVGIISGITVLGSGLSPMAQKIIFDAILFLGLWFCLTVVVGNYMFGSILTTLLWIGMTMVYIIGLGTQMSVGTE